MHAAQRTVPAVLVSKSACLSAAETNDASQELFKGGVQHESSPSWPTGSTTGNAGQQQGS